MKTETMSYNDLAAEFDMLLRTLEEIVKLNSRGKSKQIADIIRPILTHYNRNK